MMIFVWKVHLATCNSSAQLVKLVTHMKGRRMSQKEAPARRVNEYYRSAENKSEDL